MPPIGLITLEYFGDLIKGRKKALDCVDNGEVHIPRFKELNAKWLLDVLS